jgi:hypothetical protein
LWRPLCLSAERENVDARCNHLDKRGAPVRVMKVEVGSDQVT